MRFDNLDAWLAWQAGLNPRTIDLGLDRVREVWRELGSPSLGAPVITIAGTNGKGSSVAVTEAILQQGGYRTACYTSPHLQRYNERIRVDRTPVDDDTLCKAFERIDRARGDIALTYFEFGTLAALWIFAAAGVDAIVLEVGLGGRLDAVNLVDSDVALIAQVGLDHQDWLGDNIEAIGREKAGIMRPGRPAVYSGSDMPDSIATYAGQVGAGLLVNGRHYRVERHDETWDLLAEQVEYRGLPRPAMHGAMQIDNAAGVLVALDALRARLPLERPAIDAGLQSARLAGRFDVRPGHPTWILDVAHNPQAAARLDDMLGEHAAGGHRTAVFGALGDKDVAGIGRALRERFERWCLVDLSAQPRGLSAGALAERLAGVVDSDRLQLCGDVATTLDRLAAGAAADDMFVVFGSFLTVGAAMDWIDARG
ncbi:MAG: bifunctional tetrahydrofolate synthase/dihydrofolate synthase [Gammaproteobacteria bacterium]|nr:bifunctional tetrahydrofolate synthase/dihydrofolate synthase [Gammaproteobacteria bacterium]